MKGWILLVEDKANVFDVSLAARILTTHRRRDVDHLRDCW